jgi:hypothetical protein
LVSAAGFLGSHLVRGFEAAHLSLIGFAERLAEEALEILLRLAPQSAVVLEVHLPEPGAAVRRP